MNDTVIVITGAEPLRRAALDALPARGLVLAADGALDVALAAGLVPAGLVGDLDSVSPEGLAWAEEHATIQRHAPDKDHTDTELALRLAVGLDPALLVLVAGGGDRLDHSLAAIGALGHPSLTSIPRIEAWWGDQHLIVVHGPGRATIETACGATVSLLALHGPCTGVGTTGLRWALDGAELAPLVGHGLSNEATADHVEVSVASGVLTVVVVPSDRTGEGSWQGSWEGS